MSETFDPDWLLLREPFDHSACSLALANQFTELLPARPRLLDLGAGTGSLFRLLAPVVARAQAWTLVDADEELLGEAFNTIAAWGEAQRWTVTWPGRALLLHTPSGAWRVEGLVADLANAPAGLPLALTDAVVCSAFLDLVSVAWLGRLAPALQSPFLAFLTIDGRDVWMPRDPLDAAVISGERLHQSRDKGLGPALGVRATAAASRIFAENGLIVRSAPSDWRIPRAQTEMLGHLVREAAGVARQARPLHRDAITGWETRRLRQAAAGRLAARIGHRDMLALQRR
jgi:SAM-dependent methyltransferase